ncbi:MAG: VOC family protein [Desulfobacteraceae bacterium]|jgi:predicted esterase/catechol 2,3-dioxygenase-like lactoylglutathione lyase family enzyme|nr:VOC family protein [Desulfobacteraceae bacterium]
MELKTSQGAIGAIHHITAISGSAAATDRFYRRLLGLRRVKQTVNFDDPGTYHLYYGDGLGRPGTLLTFFPWEDLPAGRAGTGALTAVSLAVPSGALPFWQRRLTSAGIDVGRDTRFGRPLLAFSDPDGLHLELVETEAFAQSSASGQDGRWIGPVPPEAAVVGIFGATASVREGEAVNRLLLEQLGMQPVGRHGRCTRYVAEGTDGPGRIYDLVIDPSAPPAGAGAGSVHHIAFRAPGDEDQRLWRSRLSSAGLGVTPVIDRDYFRSIYFRTPGGILMEIATDAPGFAVDEPIDRLGRSLRLPERYESRRAEIEAGLPPLLTADDLAYRYVAAGVGAGGVDSRLIVPLHGTGGDETDLLPLAREIFGFAPAIISPRGAVAENGMRRFFRRLGTGQFDAADVGRRAHQLADFLLDAREIHGLERSSLTALGYSNGANIAAAVMLLRPEVFDTAILLRPTMPLAETGPVDLTGKRVLIVRGRHDTVIPARQTDALEAVLTRAGAEVCAVTLDADHRLTAEDRRMAMEWIQRPEACLAA